MPFLLGHENIVFQQDLERAPERNCVLHHKMSWPNTKFVVKNNIMYSFVPFLSEPTKNESYKKITVLRVNVTFRLSY